MQSQTPSTGLRHPSFLWRKVPESDARSVVQSVAARSVSYGLFEGPKDMSSWELRGSFGFPL